MASRFAKSVSIVVVNWNGLDFIEECLVSACASLEALSLDTELIVVDNNSTDGSLALIENRFPDARLIRNDTNRGFSPACNQAFAVARGDLIATLNNDAVADRLWLQHAIRELDANPSVGSVAAQMRYLQDHGRINSAGLSIDRAGRAWDRLGGETTNSSEQSPVHVFGASAGAAVYRKVMLEELGGFDCGFFAFYEDADLAWRARRAGWTCLYVPDAIVYHKHGASASRVPAYRNFLVNRNRTLTFLRNASQVQLLRFGFRHIMLSFAMSLHEIVAMRSFGAARGALASLLYGYRVRLQRGGGGRLPLDAFCDPAPFITILRRRNAIEAIKKGVI